MSAVAVLWSSFVRLFAAAPSSTLAADSSESWANRVSRERGWPTEPRSSGGVEPLPGNSSYLAGGSLARGGDCGGDAGSGFGDSG